MKYVFQTLIAVLIFIVSGCTDNPVQRKLFDVESLIREYPDSALVILDSMDRNSLKTEKSKAHHALLYAMALDKNYIDVADDSIANVAVNYFSKRGPKKYYARSLYYLGLAYYYQGEYSKAITEFTNSESIALTSDSLYLGFAKVAQADTYGKSYNYKEEERNLKEAYDIFCSLAESYYSQAVSIRLAQVYSNTDRVQEADDILTGLLNTADVDCDLRSSALTTLAYMNVVKVNPDFVRAEKFFRQNNDEYANANMTIKRYWAWAYSLYSIGRKEEAQELIDQLVSMDSSVAVYWQYLIAKSNEDFRLSLTYLEDSIKSNNSEFMDIINQSIATSHREYYEIIAEKSKYEVQKARLMILITAMIIVFLFTLIIVLVTMYSKRQAYLKEKYLLHVSEIKHQLEESTREDYPLLKKKYLSLYRAKFEMVGALYEHLMHSKDLTNAEESLYKKVDAIVIDFTQGYRDSEKFEAMLDKDLDNIMSNLHSEVPGLKKIDYEIFSLFVIGFDVTTISHMLNTSMNTIYIRKSRIKRHIEEMDPCHKKQFLEVLG